MLHWAFLKESLDRIKNLATQYKIYVVLGAHRKQPQIKNLLRLLI